MACSTSPSGARRRAIGDLVQRQPREGTEPSERTDVTLLYDADHLYIGVVARDSEPARVIGTQMARDGSIMADDRIEILLDTFRDQRSAFYFATNPSGALVDGLVANGQLNADWDAIWDVRTRRTPEGWVAEFAIPFKSLGFPAGHTVWGFNIARNIYRKLEDVRWSGARLDTQFLQVSEAGEITQLVRLSQGIGLDVRPFLGGPLAAARRHRRRTAKPGFDAEPGLDLFYNITPSLKLTATFNTDFGETEVDARQINLSRFSVLFPEKRSFFLEGAGVFNFASTGPEPAGGIPPAGADVYPVLQPPDWAAQRPGSPARRRAQAHRNGRPHGRGRAQRPHRRHRSADGSSTIEDALRRPGEAEPVPAVVRRRHLHERQSRARHGRARPTARTSGSRRRGSWAGRATSS